MLVTYQELKGKLVTIFEEIIKDKTLVMEELKTEDGKKYPKEAYLYVPEADKPSSWKLRIWETPESKVTRSQLGRAAAALSEGGFRGQKIDLPTDEVKAVKNKLISLYKKDGAEKEEIPSYLFSENEGGEDSMGDNVKVDNIKLEELEKKLNEFEKEKKVLEDKYVTMIDSLKKEADKKVEEAEKRLSERDTELHTEKVNKKIDELLHAGIWPVVAEKAKTIMLHDRTKGTIKLDDKTEKSVSDIVVDMLNSIPLEARISFEEKTNASGTKENKYMSEDEVLKYAADNKISFGEACSVLAKEGKLEFLRLS